MLLATTSAKIEFVLGENHSTNQIPGYAAWYDSATTDGASSAGANSNDTTQVTIVASPAASTIRQVNELTIVNTDTIAHTVTVRFNDGTNQFIIQRATLQVGAALIYSKNFGWIINANFTAGQLLGTATNDNAAAGNVGELISSKILVGSGVSLTTATPKDITSISLTPGDWDVWGNVGLNPAGTVTGCYAWTSTTSGTLPTDLGNNGGLCGYQGISTINSCVFPAGFQRISLSATTTVYLSADAIFSSTCVGYGFIGARRRR